MHIKIDDLTHPDVLTLLAIHLGHAEVENPPNMSHALPLSALRAAEITLWSVWEEGDLMGFGALKEHSPYHGELKSMHTAKTHRRKGVSSALIAHITLAAKARGYTRLSLETHPTEGYAAARALYQRHGFSDCGPFGSYTKTPNSVFMTLKL